MNNASYTWNPETPFNDMPDLPPRGVEFDEFSDVLQEAREEIIELRGFISGLPDHTHYLVNPVYLGESISSSEIEDVNTTMIDVMEQRVTREVIDDDSAKVLRYKKAILSGWKKIRNEQPINQRFIQDMHSILLPEEKHALRDEKATIQDSNTGEVRYTPPLPEFFSGLLTNWENFVNTNQAFDPLVRIAISHYQFESIHPFRDGNGRVGRIVAVLQLIKYDMLPFPAVHLSRYINKNRETYYRVLLNVTRHEDWESLIAFMLNGLSRQARRVRVMLRRLEDNMHQTREKIKKETDIYREKLVESIFNYPVINPTKLSEEMDIHIQTASKYLKKLAEINILNFSKQGRNSFYINSEALEIIDSY